jgi:PAS domain S-box-containing protein
MIMPLILNTTSIPITSSFMSVFSITSAVALSRYRLFSVSETLHSETLLDNMSDIVFTVSPERQITYINRYGAELLGLPEGRIEGYSLHELFPADSRVLNIFVQKVLLPTMRGRHVENCHGMLKRKDGQPIHVLFAADPLDEGEKVQGILVVSHDITEMKHAEEHIREKNVELERSNAELETFAFVASHDMKEPLRMVSNYTQLLATRYQDQLDHDGKEFINYAVEGVHRMQQLINDLLNYARIGKTEPAHERVDLNDLLAEVQVNLKAEIEKKEAILHIASLPVVKGVRSQFTQVFQNLIGNAMKFCEGCPPEIWVNVKDDGDEWLFSVKDNGIGIDEVYREKVFMLFQRLHNRERYAGTGIGLTVCKKIIELHGGRIWFDSQLGKGTTFYFTLPK